MTSTSSTKIRSRKRTSNSSVSQLRSLSFRREFPQCKSDLLNFSLTGTQGAHNQRNARAIAVAPDGNIYVTDTGNKRVVVFSPEGKSVATCGADDSIKFWDTTTWKEIPPALGQKEYVISLAFSPNGRTLATASADGTMKLWNVATRRELSSGLVLGGILGLVGFLRITVWSLVSPQTYGPHWPLVALTIWVALIGVVMWGTLAGSLLPLALKRIGLDPAVSSAPFVATLVDVTGIVIYFQVAAQILRGTLL